MTLRLGSLFAGIGGFDRGFELAGCQPVWAVEIDPACQRVLRHHFPNLHIESDVREVGAHNLETVDIITFGSPCQDLSVAGQRKGLEGERSGLFYEAVRIIRELDPDIAIWENVTGALSSNERRDFAAALSALVGCTVTVPADGWGTCGVVFGPLGQAAWRVLDAQYFGLAQRRERVFVVYDPRRERAGEFLVELGGMPERPRPRREAWQDATPLLEVGARTNGDGYRDGDGIGAPGDPMYTLQATKRHGVAVPHYGICDAETVAEDVMPTLSMPSATGGGRPAAVAIPFDMTQVTSVVNRQRLAPGNPSPTLHAAGGAHVICIQDARPTSKDQNGLGISDGAMYTLDGVSQHAVAFDMVIRKLTPRETERLQGFEDDWTRLDPEQSNRKRYRQTGNAVAVPVAAWLARRIATHPHPPVTAHEGDTNDRRVPRARPDDLRRLRTDAA